MIPDRDVLLALFPLNLGTEIPGWENQNERTSGTQTYPEDVTIHWWPYVIYDYDHSVLWDHLEVGNIVHTGDSSFQLTHREG